MRKSFIICTVVLGLFGCEKAQETEVFSLAVEDSLGQISSIGVPAPSGETVSVYAGFSDDQGTRSRLEVEGSAAKVLWTRGDSFRCLFGFNDSGRYYYTIFRTQDDGVVAAAFSTSSDLSGTGFHCFYPTSSKVSTLPDGSYLYGFNLPTSQNAVAGGIEEGLNRAFAYTDNLTKTLDEPLQFYNAISLIKFRLDGAVVSRVKEITFTGSGSIAGDYSFLNVDGIPTESTDYYFTDDVKSSKVVLKGDFVANTDYYIAIWPRKMTWFRMEFSDGKGGTTLKESSKNVTFERSRIKDFGTIHLGNDFVNDDSSSYETVKYMSATEGSKPVTIAVIPEGFTKDELSQFELLAKSGIDALFDTEPYKTYQKRFNVYFLKVPSLESGASVTDGQGTIKKAVSSYFGAQWGESSYGDMTAEESRVFDFVNENCPDILNGIHSIDEVPILMIINDSRYGGICKSISDGRGYGMVPYVRDGEGLYWYFPTIIPSTDDPLPTPVDNDVLNAYFHGTTQEEIDEMGVSYGDWRNIVIHEFGGHCFGRLGDEYWNNNELNYYSGSINGHYWPIPFALNLTHNPASAPWAEMLEHQEELVSRDSRYGRIGTFQGGDNYLYGRWRSEKISCMIDNRFYFSAWQRYLIAQRIFTLSGDQDRFSFEGWLAKDVTVDPVRDIANSSTLGSMTDHRSYIPVGPLPPPVLVEL